VKFFFWVALPRRLWTTDRRKRHDLQETDECVPCGQEKETIEHLALGCVVARQLWFLLLEPVGLTVLVPERPDDLGEWWMQQRVLLHPDARLAFDTLLLLTSWTLWKERNSRTFRGIASTVEIIYRTLIWFRKPRTGSKLALPRLRRCALSGRNDSFLCIRMIVTPVGRPP
jgi:ribosomal protein S14